MNLWQKTLWMWTWSFFKKYFLFHASLVMNQYLRSKLQSQMLTSTTLLYSSPKLRHNISLDKLELARRSRTWYTINESENTRCLFRMTKLVGILTNVYVLLLCREPFLLLRGRLRSLWRSATSREIPFWCNRGVDWYTLCSVSIN